MRLIVLILLSLAASLHAGEAVGEDFNEDDNHEYASLPPMRLSGEFGISKWLYNPDSVSSDYDRYLNRLELGQSLSAELAYFFWPKGGLGVNWIWFISRATGEGFTEHIGTFETHQVRERMSVWYAGPDFLTRMHLTQNTLLIGGLGVGYLNYTNTGIDNSFVYRATAENYALQVHVGTDYSIFRFLALGLEGRFLFSNVREIIYNHKKFRAEDPENKYMWYNLGLYRFELSAALHFLL